MGYNVDRSAKGAKQFKQANQQVANCGLKL